jgi:hypothetical protein
VILWQSVTLVEYSKVPEENHQPVASNGQNLSRKVGLSITRNQRILTHKPYWQLQYNRSLLKVILNPITKGIFSYSRTHKHISKIK